MDDAAERNGDGKQWGRPRARFEDLMPSVERFSISARGNIKNDGQEVSVLCLCAAFVY